MRSRSPILATATLIALGLATLNAPAASAAEVTNTIAEVQGTGQATPLAGTTVTVEGVVTGDYRASSSSGYRGFYLQSATPSGVDGASDGIFVFAANADPAIAVGDLVRVTGPASEFNGQTQITASAASAYEVVDDAVGVPDAVELANDVTGTEREAFEGMLVTPEEAYLSSSHQLANFGTLWLSVGELAVKSTETEDAGAEATAIAAENRANRLLVDDGYSLQTTNASHPGDQPYFTTDEVVRNGDRFVSPDAGMILGWGFDDWRLQPQYPLSSTSPSSYDQYEPTFETVNPRTAAPEDVGGDISVATFNVFNYFTTFGGDARGADNAEDFAVQQSKIVAAINALDADVVGLMEIENSAKLGEEPGEATGNLIAALNADLGETVWRGVPTPDPLKDPATTDFIQNDIIYKSDAVETVGDSFTDIDETVWDIAREPLGQTFVSTEEGSEPFAVIANHFKSKSAPSGNTAPEPADGQGFFTAERVEQATAVADLVAGVKADGVENVAVLGDFNAYAEEDPTQVLTAAGLVDLVPTETDEYTYTFDGELGSLDHVFVTPEFAESVTGVDVWNINSPEWAGRGFDSAAAEPGTPYRSSDHDPIVFGFANDIAPVDIDIVSVNDFHGRIEAAPPIAGAAVLGGMVNAYREANPNTVFVGAGDFIGASTFTSFIQQDEPTIDALNEIGLETSAFGNHEFDQGRADVDERILPRADWDYLAANLYDRATGEPAYQEYDLKEFGDVTVGFVGAVTDTLPTLVSPDKIASLEVRDVVPEVNRVADQLSDGDESNGEADVIVLLVHEGAATTSIESATDDSDFGQIVNGANAEIDAIISGHTHLAYDHEIPIAGTDRVRPVISSGQYGEKFSHTSLSVDPVTHELLDISAEVLPLAGAYDPDPEVAAIVADAVAVAKVLGAVKVGEITADLNRAKQTAAGSENRGGESTLGNFVADVQVAATGTDLALMNPGGLRADLKFASSGAGDPDGNVTYAEAANVQSFANTLVTMDLTGAQLRSVLEEQWQPATATRPFLKLGVSKALEYSYDPTAAAGSRITDIYVNDELVTDADSFRITVNSFLAAGGDNFTTLTQGTNRADSGQVDLAAMVDYFEANPVVTPDYAQRSVGVVVTPAAETYEPGEEVTLDLSSLLFTNGEPNAGTAVVSAGETELGSAALDPTIVDTTDETGRATVTITIPDAASGPLVLTVAVPETGTSIPVTLEVASSLEEITVVREPRISGSPRVGRTLSVTDGRWSVTPEAFAYQWNRNGEPIDGATGEQYTVVAADAGAELTVTVTVSAEGFADGRAQTAAVEVAKLASSVDGQLSSSLIRSSGSVVYTGEVTASGAVPTGEVALYDGSRKLTTVTLAENGSFEATLSGFSRGIHLVTARYVGSDAVAASRSWPSFLLVW